MENYYIRNNTKILWQENNLPQMVEKVVRFHSTSKRGYHRNDSQTFPQQKKQLCTQSLQTKKVKY